MIDDSNLHPRLHQPQPTHHHLRQPELRQLPTPLDRAEAERDAWQWVDPSGENLPAAVEVRGDLRLNSVEAP